MKIKKEFQQLEPFDNIKIEQNEKNFKTNGIMNFNQMNECRNEQYNENYKEEIVQHSPYYKCPGNNCEINFEMMNYHNEFVKNLCGMYSSLNKELEKCLSLLHTNNNMIGMKEQYNCLQCMIGDVKRLLFNLVENESIPSSYLGLYLI